MILSCPCGHSKNRGKHFIFVGCPTFSERSFRSSSNTINIWSKGSRFPSNQSPSWFWVHVCFFAPLANLMGFFVVAKDLSGIQVSLKWILFRSQFFPPKRFMDPFCCGGFWAKVNMKGINLEVWGIWCPQPMVFCFFWMHHPFTKQYFWRAMSWGSCFNYEIRICVLITKCR